jgi:hypothetical protein
MSGANGHEMTPRTRREIRRAFGPDAVAVLQQQQAQIQVLRARVDGLSVEHTRLVNVTAHDGARISTLTLALQTFIAKPFLQRLRWLFTGR